MAIDTEVFRSLMKRKLVFGVPLLPLIVTIFFTALMFIGLENWVVIPVAVLFVFFMGLLSRRDEFLLETFFGSLLEPDLV